VNTFAPDDVDFAAYEWQTECKAKLRTAASYAEKLATAMEPKAKDMAPSVFSLRMKNLLRFRPGEVTAWAGYSGHRKSMLTGQVGLELSMQKTPTAVISLEMPPADTLTRMLHQHAGTDKPRDLERFFNATDHLWLFDHVGRLTPHQALSVCRYFAEQHGGQQVFIDSFMMVCASEERLDEQKQFATDLARLAQETGLHVHLIAHCRKPQSGDESKPPGKHDLKGTSAIADQAHNVVTVWANKAKEARLLENEFDPIREEPDAAVTVCKQRNGTFEGRIKLWFDKASMRFTDAQEAVVDPW
jgi:twinkle protein